jgi:hypothetical protein
MKPLIHVCVHMWYRKTHYRVLHINLETVGSLLELIKSSTVSEPGGHFVEHMSGVFWPCVQDQVSAEILTGSVSRWQFSAANCFAEKDKSCSVPGLPDGLFSNQKFG